MGRLNEPCAWLLTQQSSSWSENRLICVWFTFVRWNSNSYIQVSPAFTLKTNRFTLFDSCCCCLWARMQVQRSTAAQKHPDNKPAESGQSFTASSHTRPSSLSHISTTHTHTGKNFLPMSQRTHNWFDGSHFFSLCGLKSGSLCRCAGKWVIHLHMRHWGRACPPLLPLQHNKRCSALK